MPKKWLDIPARKGEGYLTGQLLIATPQIQFSCFHHAVVYVCAHSEQGAMGVIINQPLPEYSMDQIYEYLKIDASEVTAQIPIHFGGPVDGNRGMVLHSAEYVSPGMLCVDDKVALSTNVDVLRDALTGKGPSFSMLALGYAGWSPGQLEAELEKNSWITVPATYDLIFGSENASKWMLAAKSIDIDPLHISTTAGHA